MKQLNRPCPLCGCETGEPLSQVRMHNPEGYRLPNEYYVVACANCGFTFADTTATAGDYDYYYTHCNAYSDMASRSADLLHRGGIILRFLEGYVDKTVRVLDMGCGSGALLEQMQAAGYSSLCGADPSSASVASLKARGIEGRLCSVFEAPPADMRGAFGLVICSNVFEHLLLLHQSVENLLGYLAPGGLLLLDLPNVLGFSRYYMPAANYFNHEHINYFSGATLDRLLASHGCVRRSQENDGYVWNEKRPELSCMALYERQAGVAVPQGRDTASAASVRAYFDQHTAQAGQTAACIARLRSQGRPVVVWGMGAYTAQLLANTELEECNIRFFVDNNTTKVGLTQSGRPVCGPETLLRDIAQEDAILICSMFYAQDILKQIRAMGLENECIIC